MKMVHIDSCPVCGSANLKIDFSCNDYYASNETFELYRCADCSFLFTQDFPNEDNIGKYYETEKYISHSNNNKGLVNKLYHIVRKNMMKKKALIVNSHTTSSSRWLLDIGCGIGHFLSYMSANNWSVKGVEKNKEAREFAKNNYGILTDSPETLNKYEELTFGVITLWHSLEHLENLNETLKKINKLLVENGTVFIAVPNSNSADAKYYKEKWAAYDVPRHLWHFSPDTMKIITKNNGFGIEKIHPMPFDAFYVSILSERYKDNKWAFIKGMLVGLRCYIKSIKDIKKSSSIIYVLKKQEVLNFNR